MFANKERDTEGERAADFLNGRNLLHADLSITSAIHLVTSRCCHPGGREAIKKYGTHRRNHYATAGNKYIGG